MSSAVRRNSCQSLRQFERQLLARQRVERAERLVEQQHCRIGQQGAAKGGALLHAAGQHVGPMIGEILQPRQLKKPLGSLAGLLPGSPITSAGSITLSRTLAQGNST